MPDSETLPKPKHPGGRPSKYRKEFCEKIVACGKEGMCVAEMADALDVRIATLYNWSDEFPEFLEAFSRAQEAAESYWASSIRSGLKKPPSEFQGPANLKYMAQRFKGWSEKAHVDTRETDPDSETETPDLRGEARRAAFLLSKGAARVE